MCGPLTAQTGRLVGLGVCRGCGDLNCVFLRVDMGLAHTACNGRYNHYVISRNTADKSRIFNAYTRPRMRVQ
jgi:hypothetical protein